MKILFTILLLLVTSITYATEQKVNTIIYKDKKYFFNHELSYSDIPLKKENAINILLDVEFSTANWSRNPYVVYEIKENKLFVKNVHLDSDNKNSITTKLFPSYFSRFLEKTSTIAILTTDFPFVNSMSPCAKNCTLLNIENGKVVKKIEFTQENFKKHCNELYVKAKNKEKEYIKNYVNTCKAIFFHEA